MMFRVEATRIYDGPWDDLFDDEQEGTTIDVLMSWMMEKNVPRNAIIRYAGCGSHNIEFVWEAREGEERDAILRVQDEAARRETARIADQRERGLLV